MTLDPTPLVKRIVESTPTAQMRRVVVPPHRRRSQVLQTLWGVVAGLAGVALVWVLDAPMVWYLVAVLFGLRIASKELLLDCIKIARDVVGIFTGAKDAQPPI